MFQAYLVPFLPQSWYQPLLFEALTLLLRKVLMQHDQGAGCAYCIGGVTAPEPSQHLGFELSEVELGGCCIT